MGKRPSTAGSGPRAKNAKAAKSAAIAEKHPHVKKITDWSLVCKKELSLGQT